MISSTLVFILWIVAVLSFELNILLPATIQLAPLKAAILTVSSVSPPST